MSRKNAAGDQYFILNDASHYESALAHGKTEVWYFRPELARDIMMGLDWLQTQVPEAYPEPYNLSRTHVMLGRVKSVDKNGLFRALQGEYWSPNGEARALIENMGLNHTSMSVGDMLVIKGIVWYVDTIGWARLGRVDGGE